MYEKLLVLSHKMETNPLLDAIKRGCLMCVPLLMLGIVASILNGIPIAGVQDWYANTPVGGVCYQFLDCLYRMTLGAMALYVGVAASYMYVLTFEAESRYVSAACIFASYICVLLSMGFAHEGFNTSRYDAKGVFVAFMVSVLCVKLFFTIYQWIGKRHTLSFSANIERRIYSIYWTMVPFCACIIVFYGFNEILYQVFDVVSIHDAFVSFISATFVKLGNNYGSALLMMGSESLMWFFGIHGGGVMEQVMSLVFAPANTDPTLIVSRTFLDTFTLIGGCGTAMSLFIALLLFGRRKESRAILGTVAFPILFNVNEPLIFGLPVIFNPILVIPFMLTPLVSVTIAYFATIVGFIPITTAEVAWTTPVFFSGCAATGSWRGAFVQLIIVVVGIFIYAPFVKMMEKTEDEKVSLTIGALQQYFKEHMDDQPPVAILKQHNSWAIAASKLVGALEQDIEKDGIPMYYQPQVDGQGKLYGAEALLRWQYGGETLFPPFVIHMAQEAGMEDDLARCIMRQVCRDIVQMREAGMGDIRVSVNISAEQLNNDVFVTDAILLAKHYKVEHQLGIEVTEEMSIERMAHASESIRRLNGEGVQVSMDDFSMGTTSIKSLQENNFSHVKLDGTLVADME
ncbi:MAG: EAL domain-containing protein, partial [Lachnospiraceae bacterium]|nr:EAL domain-containing protein [Lachnospiraceae bacterium]